METNEKIDILFENFCKFLQEKNNRYGDSALKPENVFCKASTETQISTRLDDKLSRIRTSETLRKNDVADVFGYIALLLIQNDWLEFEDLLD